ncbi:MAG: aminoglycoside phosphotransferase family protein [Oscillospiraceae bacterium]|nr:aminoglycoside phosphotransferase family protein [Oscillospiraceae bacterium]
MYSAVVRSDEYMLRLRNFVSGEYGINVDSIVATKRGFYGETWKLHTPNAHYFMKLVYCDEHKSVYEQSFPIIQHLYDHGIDFISQIVKTASGQLSTRFDGAVVGVFDWIDGENIETNETKIPEYQMLAKIYTIPYVSLNIQREDFSSTCSDEFWTQQRSLKNTEVLSLLNKHHDKIKHRSERLILFSKLCHNDNTGFVITHGDAGGNFFVSNSKSYIVDWDGVTLTPPERDAWVMCSHAWAQDAFNSALRENNINYRLRPERLAYYCYRFFFFYLNSFLYAGTEADIIEEYLDGWIENSFLWADGVK